MNFVPVYVAMYLENLPERSRRSIAKRPGSFKLMFCIKYCSSSENYNNYMAFCTICSM